jgi:outer membrane protein TolC
MKRLALSALLPLVVGVSQAADATPAALTLEQAVQTALRNHRSLKVSAADVALAEAQFQQAMAAFRPRIDLEAGFQRADQDRTFTFAGTIQTPAMDIGAALGPVLGPLIGGLPPASQQQIGAALAQGGATLPSQSIPMNIEVKMFDRDVTRAAINLTYPLYTGGKKEAVTALASTGVDLARQAHRKTELDVVRDVSRYYHGAQLARQMLQLTSDTLERFQALDDLTGRLFQNASLKVKRTDYLRSKTTTALVRSAWQEATYGHTMARLALANAMGLPPGSTPTLAPPSPALPPELNAQLDQLVSDALTHNPDKQRLELAIEASTHQIAEAKSEFMPMVGLEASVYQVRNAYHDGLFNAANRNGWTLGIGMKWNLFDGGLARASVDGAQARKIRLESQRMLLDQGLALQVRDDVMRIQRSRDQLVEMEKAQALAQDNRKLHVRAYQEELVDTKDVIEAQLVESFTSASLYRARYELQNALADLDYHVGRALPQRLP